MRVNFTVMSSLTLKWKELTSPGVVGGAMLDQASEGTMGINGGSVRWRSEGASRRSWVEIPWPVG